MTKFYIHTFGCRVNRVESDRIAAQLEAQGWTSASLAQADIAIINTCTVTGEADHKNRKEIRRCLKSQPGPVLLTGCAINVAAADYRAMDPRIMVESDKLQVAACACRLMDCDRPLADEEFFTAYGEGYRTRAGIKIQDGCNNACTFCIVHTARGKARSMPADEVIHQARELIAHGAEEIVLVGIDVGAYQHEGVSLAKLIRRLLDETEVGRIRIPSIEPQSVTDDFIQLMASADGRLCRHLHLVMQSGSGKVLHEMARHYSTDEYRALVERLRAAVPQLALSTDVIVGFPGETEEDFQKTCQMVRDCQMMRLHVFPYSKRPGTPAAARTDQVDALVKTRRVKDLTRLGEELALEDMRRRLGQKESVVIEREGRGTTESFHEIRFDSDAPIGSLVKMRLAGIDEETLSLLGQ